MEQNNDDLRNRFTAWLKLVVKRARIDYIRKLKRHSAEVAVEDEFLRDKIVYEHSDEELGSMDGFLFGVDYLNDAIYKLPEKRRQILELLFIHNLTSEEIAEMMHCTVQNIYNQRSLALKELKKLIMKGKY